MTTDGGLLMEDLAEKVLNWKRSKIGNEFSRKTQEKLNLELSNIISDFNRLANWQFEPDIVLFAPTPPFYERLHGHSSVGKLEMAPINAEGYWLLHVMILIENGRLNGAA